MGYEINIDIAKIDSISEYLREVRKKYWQFESEFTGVDPRVLTNQVPGGMISNLSNQLKDQDALDKMDDVLKEIPGGKKRLRLSSSSNPNISDCWYPSSFKYNYWCEVQNSY